MKKLLILISIGIVLTTASTFGQAYFSFGSPPHRVWDDTLDTGPTIATGFDAVFLWGPMGDTPLVSGIINGTPTNNTVFINPYAGQWQDILTDPNFTIASTGTGSTATEYIASANANGSFAYDDAIAVPVTGTTSGTTYALIVVAWNTEGGLYTTPSEAAAAGAPVGWSPVFDYTAGYPPPSTPPALTNPTPFGIYPAPEPTTLTLAGLGGISMILIRRRKR
jgi:PEP-CTERM motif